MIQLDKNFQYSVNLKYDFSDSAKIGKYIFTPNSVEILKRLFNSVEADTNDKAHFLIGAYGKGKSHLMLVLLNLLSLQNSDEIKIAREKIGKIDKDFENRIEKYFNDKKKILKVVIDGDISLSLPNLFLKSLISSLEKENLSNLVPETFFSSVIETVENWKNNYPDTFEKFKEKIENHNIEEFLTKIENQDEESYKLFTEIYPTLTSGSKFSLKTEIDIVETYNSVVKKLSQIGYKGIYVVFDEFSKYLEANIEDSSKFDTTFLQKFAENISKSKKDRQIHLLLITHKAFYNYLPKNLVNTWKTIAGRFDELHLDSSLNDSFKIISSVIKKDERKFAEFKDKNKDIFEKTENTWKKYECFLKYENVCDIFEKAYPLHPVSLYSLPLISEKCAQNERTVFTFLASDTQKNTLSDWLQKKSSEFFLTPDNLFDYFSPIFAQFPFDSEVFKTNVKCTTALSKLEGENFALDRKIVKAIAILLLIDGIKCNEKTIIDIFGEDAKEILKNLLKNGTLMHFEVSDNLKFPEYSSIDIKKLVLDKVNKLSKTSTLSKILTEYSKTTAIYPVGYNDDNSVTRFLRVSFSDSPISKIEQDEKRFCDGEIVCVVGKCPDSISKSDSSKKFVVNVYLKNNCDSKKIEEYALKYEASRQIIEELVLKNDFETANVMKTVCDDYGKFLNKLLDDFISFDERNVVFIDEEKNAVKNKIDFDEKISNWFNKRFDKFPKILNEFVNRNKISAQTQKSVKNILDALFDSKILQENLGFSKNSQEATIFRSIFDKNKVFQIRNNEWDFNPFSSDVKNANLELFATFEEIRNFINSDSENLSELYSILTEKIGLRKGLIPLLLGAVLKIEKNVYFSKNSNNINEEFSISSDILLEINSAPNEYSIKRIKNDSETQKFLNEVKNLYTDFIQGESNDDIVRGLSKWFVGLPKYTKSCMDSSSKKIFEPLGKSKINTNEYLFEKLMAICDFKTLNQRKTELDSFIKNKIQEIRSDCYELFAAKNDSELDEKIGEWFQSLSAETKNHVFGNFATNVMTVFSGEHNDIDSFIRELAIKISGVSIENWGKNYGNEDSLEHFISELKSFKKSYDEYEKIISERKLNEIQSGMKTLSENECAIQFVKNGKKIVKTFDFETKETSAVRFLRNEMRNNLGEYQESLSKSQKCAVLFELMKEILEK